MPNTVDVVENNDGNGNTDNISGNNGGNNSGNIGKDMSNTVDVVWNNGNIFKCRYCANEYKSGHALGGHVRFCN